MSSELESYLRELEAKHNEDVAFLQRLKANTPEGVDVEARAESVRNLDVASQIDAEVIKALKHISATVPTTVVQRFGHVLYWLGCAIAVATLGLGIFVFVYVPPDRTPNTMIGFVAIAVLIWLAGRACRYVFSGN
jgi:hypothetical protein